MLFRLLFLIILLAVFLVIVNADEPREYPRGWPVFPDGRRPGHGPIVFKNQRGLVGGLANTIGNTVDGILDSVLGGVGPKPNGGVLGGFLGK